jgi:EAL and modified HD-GYP domain-containing signal transduction protein
MNSAIATRSAPLFSLQPVADAQHGWVAMLLATPTPLDRTDLARLLGEPGLAEALDDLPLVVTGASPGDCVELGAPPPPMKLILRFAASACTGEGNCVHLHRLHGDGFDLLADGLPATADICPDVAGIALDCANVDRPAAAAFLAKHPGRHLATRVDTLELLDQCRQTGFVWFAGNYALRHQPGQAPRNATRQALLLQLLSLLTHDGDSHAIESLIKRDAQLSYQLLRLVNSVAFSPNHSITSFSQAITLLGRRQLQRWLQLLLYAHPDTGGKSPLLPRAALRAALMEALVGPTAEVQEQAFMVGMFSLLEAMLGTGLAKILAPLHLAGDVAGALLERGGPFGALLRVVEASEQGGVEALASALAAAKIDNTAWAGALLRASQWAIRVSREA